MDKRRLAIDPGDIHVGYARNLPGGAVESGEWRPGEACNQIIHLLTHDEIDEIIIEEFVLYEDRAKEQSWSKLLTSQLIGALKLVAYMFRIPIVEQGAYIKKPTRAQLAGRGIALNRGSIHSGDAQLHLWYRILRMKQEETQS